MRWLRYLLFLCFVTPLAGQVTQQYEAMRVVRIDVTPENLPPELAFNPQTVRARMQTKVGNFFSQAEFDQDLKCLAEEYDQIEPSIEVVGGEIIITLRVWLKPTIRSITFYGNEGIRAKRLRKELGLSVGSEFNRDEFITGFNKVKTLYIKKGYFDAEFSYDMEPVPDSNAVDIKVCIDEGSAGKIKSIEFCGFTTAEEDELLELMVTKKNSHSILGYLSSRGVYHPDMVEHDRLTILNYLQNKGYADAVVDLSICETYGPEAGISIQISAERGTRYSFGSICATGNAVFSYDQIWAALYFSEGMPYSPERLRDTIKAIRDLYGANGYIEASVDVSLSLQEECPTYDVTLRIEEGEQYCVGMIRVFGNTCTQTRLILHESLLCPGEVFNMLKLEGTEARLLNTGYFANVNVYPVRSGDDSFYGNNYRDVYIEVEETDTGHVGLFFGFNSQNSVFGGVEISEQNFNARGLLDLFSKGPRALRGGGEYAHAKANIGKGQTSYIFQWTKPYFLDTPWMVGFDLEKSTNRTLSESYTLKTWGGNVHAAYLINHFLKMDIYYRGNVRKTEIRDTDKFKNERSLDKDGFVSALGVAFIYDSTNHPRRPSHGFRSRLLTEVAGVGGEFDFVKIAYLNSYYYPISKRGVLKFRADFQTICPYGGMTRTDLPLGERLYLGGETTVRGYRNYSIGPKIDNLEPTGGLTSYLLTEEYQHNIIPGIDAFFFVDAGAVSRSAFTISGHVASVGLGLRVDLMKNMPFAIGMGWPLHPAEVINGRTINNAQRFFFSMGGYF